MNYYFFDSTQSNQEDENKEGIQVTESTEKGNEKKYDFFEKIYPEKKTSFKENESDTQ